MYQKRDERAARAKPLVLYIGALTASWRKVVGAVVPNDSPYQKTFAYNDQSHSLAEFEETINKHLLVIIKTILRLTNPCSL